VIEIPQS